MPDQTAETRPLAEGFDAGRDSLPARRVELPDGTRRRLSLALAAIVLGATPEELAAMLADGFPPEVEAALERVGEAAELSDHVDLLVGVLHADGVLVG